MVNFEDGQLVKGAYVLINGVEYPVVMPQYSGKTPLTSENLNKVQRDLVQLVFPVRKYIYNTNKYKSSYDIRIWDLGKIKGQGMSRIR